MLLNNMPKYVDNDQGLNKYMNNIYNLPKTSIYKIKDAIAEANRLMDFEDSIEFVRDIKYLNILVKDNVDFSVINKGLNIDIVAAIFFPTEANNDILSKTSILLKDSIENNNDKSVFFHLAHELGHFFMHKSEGKAFYQYDSLLMEVSEFCKLPIEEREAEAFAYELLLPYQKFSDLYDFLNIQYKNDEKIISILSNYFFSEPQYIENRIDYLQSINKL